jgi:hypothetical protein
MQLLAERTRAADEFASCPDVACAGSVVDVDAETIDTVPVIVQHQFAPFLGSRTWASVTGARCGLRGSLLVHSLTAWR